MSSSFRSDGRDPPASIPYALEPANTSAGVHDRDDRASFATTVHTERLAEDTRIPLALVLPDGRRVALGARVLSVGKNPSCDLRIDDPTVSAVHCRIVPRREGWELRDEASTNGTRVGGVRVESARLAAGTAITLGRVRIVCCADLSAAPPREGLAATLVGDSVEMECVRLAIDRFASSPFPVLIHGESGSGKEVVARLLHARSPRARGPFVAINAAAIAPDLVESELFGHERGAFTGAAARRKGAFEEADGGTLFLDELGELPLAQQAKLLRVVESNEVRRVGGEGVVRVRIRLVCATHRDLAARVAEGSFRADLRYRLDQLRIRIPPLRDRREDIPTLAQHLLARISREMERPKSLEDSALTRLLEHDWPGNVRELYAVLCRAAVDADGERVGPEHLDLAPVHPAIAAPASGFFTVPSPPRTPRELDADAARAVVEACGGNLSRAARALGIARSTLRDRLRLGEPDDA